MTTPPIIWINELKSQANGEMGNRIADHDWSSSSIGSPETWPASLRSTLKTLLGSRYPMILLWGNDLIQFYNDSYVGLIGAKHPGALGVSIKITQAESWGAIGPMIKEVMDTGIPNWVPVQLLPLERFGYLEEAYFSLSYSAVHDDEGAVKGMLCVCSEISQQIIGERRLKLLRDLATKAGEISSVNETSSKIMQVLSDNTNDVPFSLLYFRSRGSQQMELLVSSGVDDVKGFEDKLSKKLIFSGAKSLLADINKSFKITGGLFNNEVHSAQILPVKVPGHTVDKGELVIGLSPSLAYDESYDSFIELLAGQISIALRNSEAYEEEQLRTRELTEIDRAKTLFFNNVSHEFRTPLTLLLGPLEDVLSKKGSGALVLERESLESVYRNALRLLKLVNTLLDFSRVEAQKSSAFFEPTDVTTLTRGLVGQFDSIVTRADLTYQIELDEVGEIILDKSMWEKIVLNLLSNAFKFTFSGHIKVSLKQTAEEILFEVEDTGTGIPEEDLPEMFKRFHRVQGAKSRSHEGSGIGLALIKELIELHQGSIKIRSRLGEGSAFTVILPKKFSPTITGLQAQLNPSVSEAFINEVDLWTKNEETVSQSQDETGPKATVLLVDDNADMRDYIKKVLLPSYNVLTAANGLRALELLRTSTPDLILSDVMMPEMDGFELLEKIRDDEKFSFLPFILLSARAGQESTVEGLDAGADDYLVKPFSSRELLSRVRQSLSMTKMRKGLEAKDEMIRLRDDFLTIASHELNTPLTSLKLHLQLIEKKLGTEGLASGNYDLFKKKIQSANDQVTRLSLLVSSLLDLSKIQSGDLRLELEDQDISLLVEEVVDRLNPVMNFSNCSISLNLQEQMIAKINPLSLQRALENILTNAFKYAPGSLIKITTSRTPQKNFLIVSDTGPGISSTHLKSIFNRYVRLISPNEVSGLGLGLFISKQIVEAHGGELTVSSEEGKGTSFRIEFPL